MLMVEAALYDKPEYAVLMNALTVGQSATPPLIPSDANVMTAVIE